VPVLALRFGMKRQHVKAYAHHDGGRDIYFSLLRLLAERRFNPLIDFGLISSIVRGILNLPAGFTDFSEPQAVQQLIHILG